MVLPVTNTYTISLALDKLIGFIEHELNLPEEVQFEVRLLCNRLRPINIFIKESHQSRARGDHRESGLKEEIVKQLRKAVHDAEDIIDGYIVQVDKRERMNALGKVFHYVSSQRMTVGYVSRKINELNQEFKEILQNLQNYKTGGDAKEAGTSATTSSSSMAYVEVSEEDLVGFEVERETLVKQLIDEYPNRRVVLIVGMAGSGKSTLAKMVTKHGSVKGHFDCRIWVNAEGGTADVLLEIIKGVFQEEAKQILCQNLEQKLINLGLTNEAITQLISGSQFATTTTQTEPQPINLILQKVQKMTMEEIDTSVLGLFERLEEILHVSHGFRAQSELNELVEAYNGTTSALLNSVKELDDEEREKKLCLSEIVRRKRYLLVMDNVRELEILDNLKDALPDHLQRSRILITSCQKGFPRYPNSFTFLIPKLGVDESWSLFCKMAFRDSSCPDNYQDKGKLTVKGCEGLPLALVVFGKLLEERDNKKQNLNISIFDGRERWRDKIAQSYDHLHENLKQCFFYMGVFPRNTNIPVKQLIHFWVAEGFIPEDPEKTKEKIAEEYLEDLVDKFLVQVTSRRIDNGIKTCRVHSVLLDLCVFESMKEEFLEVRTEVNLSFVSRPRRLSLQCSQLQFDVSLSSNCCDTSSVRSFLCFGKGKYMRQTDWKKLRKRIPVVRVLNLGNMEFKSFPEDIHKLVLLKYLKLACAAYQTLPDSLSELASLMTLDLRASFIISLPEGIWNMKSLRHILTSRPIKLPHPTNTAQTLPILQVFSIMVLDKNTVSLISEGQSRFPLVTKLGLYGDKKRRYHRISQNMIQNVFQHLHRLIFLEELKIRLSPWEHLVQNPSLVNLKSLIKVSLMDSKINSQDFQVLGSLPELQYLKIKKGGCSDDNATVEFSPNSFPKLEVFMMIKFDFQYWIHSQGAMPKLRQLIIKDRESLLEGIPPELIDLTELR